MEKYHLREIGFFKVQEDCARIDLHKRFAPALTGLKGYSHLNVIWWFSGFEDQESRNRLVEKAPYKSGPAELGTFATRSPLRPNPLALSCAEVISVDEENGFISISYTDAHDGSPVLDIKPYIPSLDRIMRFKVPQWCSHWPESAEESASFNWEAEFNF